MKKFLMICLAMIAGFAVAKEIRVVSIPAGSLSGTWVNNAGLPKVYTIQSAFGTLGGVALNADTVTAKVSNGGKTFTVDTGTITSNLTTVVVDFADEVCIGWGETNTISRTAVTTNEALNVMIVIE